MQPGNVKGIFTSIILPEFRATRDPRLLDYWDLELKWGEEAVAKKKLDVDVRDWQTIRRPSILWARAKDLEVLGLKNRAITEMFALVKAFPQHPEFSNWALALEVMLTSGSGGAASSSAQ
jgi:hypothetical protein